MPGSSNQDEAQSETQYEDQHVHQVYNSIASHFSSTRFKPWPIVDSFLGDLPPGSLGLDVGCGNGKYLSVRRDLFIIGSDRSSELLRFAARHQPHDVMVGDTLALPHPDGIFDFAISIAVVHHLSSRRRRREAVKCILKTLRGTKDQWSTESGRGRGKRGEALVFVWALEQKDSRRGWDKGHDQDVLVPWVLKGDGKTGKDRKQGAGDYNGDGQPGAKKNEESTTFQRYYHLYREGELEEDIEAVGGVVVRHGYDRDNWWAVCARHGDDGKGGVNENDSRIGDSSEHTAP